MKKYLTITGLTALTVFILGMAAVSRPEFALGQASPIWYPNSNNQATLVDDTWGVKVTSLANCNTIDTDGNGVFSCGVDASGAGGLSTSTTPTISHLATWTSASTLGSVATGTLTESVSGLQFDATRGLVGGSAVLSLTSGFEIPLTASTTEWRKAYASTTALTATAPLAYDKTGVFSITQSGAGTNGYLSSTDWSTFNGKLSSTDIDTSAELATLVTNETGTAGSLVFSSSPTFTGLLSFANLFGTNATVTNATTTTLGVTALNSANCDVKATTGGSVYCGTDSAGSISTSTALADTYVTYGTGLNTLGAESAFTYNYTTDLLTVSNASTTILTAKTFNGIRNANLFAGADIGAKINAAYADLPSTGGTIVVPPGSYTFSTPISITTADKPAIIECSGGMTTILNYTGTGTSTTFNYGGENVTTNPQYVAGMIGCALKNDLRTDGTTGISIGGSNGAQGVLLQGINVRDFGTGLFTDDNVWLERVRDSVFNLNAQNFRSKRSPTNSGEEVVFDGVLFESYSTYAPDCVHISHNSLTSPVFLNTSFDDCGLYVEEGNLNVTVANSHFENPSGDSDTMYDFVTMYDIDTDYTGGTNLHLNNVTFVQANVTTPRSQYINIIGGNLSVENAVVYSSADTLTSFITATNTNASAVAKNVTWSKTGVRAYSYLINTTVSGSNNQGLDFISLKDGKTPFSFTASTTDNFYFYAGNNLSATINNVGGWIFNSATATDLIILTSLRVPSGASPTVDAAGEIALDTTANQLLIATSTVADAIVIPNVQYSRFMYASSSWTGTTTLSWGGPAMQPIHFQAIDCITNTGTATLVAGNGLATSSAVTLSTATGTDALSVAIASGQIPRFQIGTPSTVQNVACTLQYVYDRQ